MSLAEGPYTFNSRSGLAGFQSSRKRGGPTGPSGRSGSTARFDVTGDEEVAVPCAKALEAAIQRAPSSTVVELRNIGLPHRDRSCWLIVYSADQAAAIIPAKDHFR